MRIPGGYEQARNKKSTHGKTKDQHKAEWKAAQRHTNMAHELKTDLARSFAYQAGITLDELLAVSPGHLVTWAGSAREAWAAMRKDAAKTPAEKLADLKAAEEHKRGQAALELLREPDPVEEFCPSCHIHKDQCECPQESE